MSTTEATTIPAREPLTTVLHPLLLFIDGDCSFCNRWAARVKNADHEHRTRFAYKQGKTFQYVAHIRPDLANVDSLVLVKRNMDGREEFLIRSAAVRTVIDGLPPFRIFDTVLHIVPRLISDLGYRILAKLRGVLFSRWHHIRVPIEEDKELFLE